MEKPTETSNSSSNNHPTTHLLSNIYEMNYKKGPIIKCVRFFALSRKQAVNLGNKFLELERQKENAKYVMIGIPQPFAIDIDEEVAKVAKLAEAAKLAV